MNTYEFSTKVSNGTVVIPQEYIQAIPRGRDIRVILVVDESTPPVHNNGADILSDNSLEELITEIKRHPSKPENIHPGNGQLAELLANPVTDPDPDFDVEEWNRQWMKIEAEMKARDREEVAKSLQEDFAA